MFVFSASDITMISQKSDLLSSMSLLCWCQSHLYWPPTCVYAPPPSPLAISVLSLQSPPPMIDGSANALTAGHGVEKGEGGSRRVGRWQKLGSRSLPSWTGGYVPHQMGLFGGIKRFAGSSSAVRHLVRRNGSSAVC